MCRQLFQLSFDAALSDVIWSVYLSPKAHIMSIAALIHVLYQTSKNTGSRICCGIFKNKGE